MQGKDVYGIENVCFSVADECNERYKRQRMERGFDDTETWNLWITVSKFILPRLRRYKQVDHFWPSVVSSRKEWSEIIDKMIETFEILSDDTEEYAGNAVEEGLDLFRKYFLCLWW